MSDDQPSSPGMEEALQQVRARIGSACRRSGRDPSEVLLIAVTKTVALPLVAEARRLGVEHFGENRARELAGKAGALPATWHFIGKLQRGTAASVAEHADWIHSAEPGDALGRVARRAAALGRGIPTLVQVDFTGRRQGVSPAAVRSFVAEASGLQGIRLAGLMTLPPATSRAEGSRPYFAGLRAMRDDLSRGWPELRELSMGMSGDYEVAVEEGATMLRVGTALFGERPGSAAR